MATGAMTITDRSLSIGRVFSRAFSVLGNNPLATFGIAFLLSALPQLAITYMTGPRFGLIESGAISVAAGVAMAGGVVLIYLVFQALVQGVIVHTTLVERDGGRATLGESIGFALGRIVPLLVAAILFALAAILGLLLLTVPFFFVVTRWAVVPSVAVAERNGIGGAFSRSADLTAGARSKILGLGFLTVIVVWLVSAVFQLIGIAVGGVQEFVAPSNPITLIVMAIGNTLTAAFWAAMQASLYVELVDWKDGASAGNLAEIFA